jgi:hypothetical protein
MGANMMPTAKKMGRTVLGVRMGLYMSALRVSVGGLWGGVTDCHAFNLCCRKAVSMRYGSVLFLRKTERVVLAYWQVSCSSAS